MSAIACERSPAVADVCRVANVRDVDHVDAAAATTPPGMEPITRADRQPANAAESATESKTDADAPATASPAEERDIRGRPNRVIRRVHSDRPRPPGPAAAINEPAAIVVRRPAPGLIRNPGPTVVGLIDPAAGAVWRPARVLRRHPDAAIVGDFGPNAVVIEIFRAGVVAVGVVPTSGVANGPVAIAIPSVPIVSVEGGGNLILRIVGAGDGDHLSGINASAALRRGDIRGTSADDDFGLRVGIYENAEFALATEGADGRVRSVNFGLCFAALQDVVSNQALPNLYLNLFAVQGGDASGRTIGQAQNVRKVELEFRAGFLAGGDAIILGDGRVDSDRDPLAVVAALRGNVTLNLADAGDALCRVSGLFRFTLALLIVGGGNLGVLRVLRTLDGLIVLLRRSVLRSGRADHRQ